MPVIKPRSEQKHVVRHITRLYRENNETLYAYAAFIGEAPEYVVNQLIGTVLAKDKEFVAWLQQHPGSYVPGRGAANEGLGRTGSHSVSGNGRRPVAQAGGQ